MDGVSNFGGTSYHESDAESKYDKATISREDLSVQEVPSRPMTNGPSGENDEKKIEEDLEANEVKSSTTELTGWRLAVVIASLCSAVFCVALDNTILSVAVPRITDAFNTIDDIGWYGTAYFLTICSLQFFYARLYSMIPVKTLFLIAFGIFELGSLICGVAPSSTCLVVGRAVAGIGGAGIFSGAMTSVALVTPPRWRPVAVACLGATFATCAVLGPLVGGALVQGASWRWCFYINLPIGVFTVGGTLLYLKVEQKLQRPNGIYLRIWKTDPVGNGLFIVSVICLLLAVEWGGSVYAWSNGRIIALFIIFGSTAIGFMLWQWQGSETAIPTHIFSNRTTMFATLFALFLGCAIFPTLYYLPTWFQVSQGVTPIMSAVHMLPLVICQVLGTFAAGFLTTRLGYYMPFVFASTVFVSVGCGLLYTMTVGEPTAHWIGYQIALGFGIGFGLQQPTVAVQSTLPPKDIPTAISLIYTALYLGGAVFVSAGQNVFRHHLRANLLRANIPGLDVELAVQAGATEFRKEVPAEYLRTGLVAYSGAITEVFKLATILACLSLLGALGMKWKNVKQKAPKQEASMEMTNIATPPRSAHD